MRKRAHFMLLEVGIGFMLLLLLLGYSYYREHANASEKAFPGTHKAFSSTW